MKKFGSYSSVLPWFMALLLSALALGCGGGRDPILGTGGLAALAPTVTAVAPLSGATDVSVDTKIVTATFSKAMDSATLTAASFTLACPAGIALTGTLTYLAASNTATLTLAPATVLPPNSLCTATVTTGATDTTGIELASDYVWTFTTGGKPNPNADNTAPTVIATINANGATGVAINTREGVTFSEAMNPLTINSSTFTLKHGTTVVAGAMSYSGVNVVFTPSSSLASNTLYTGTVTTGARDLAGNALARDYIWNWTTGTAIDMIAPTVTLVSPADQATGVAISSVMTATFSKAMDASTINAASFTVAGVTGAVTFDAVGKKATFTPSGALANATTYTATVNGGVSGVKDLFGNALAVDKVWSFTTAATAVVPPLVSLGSASTFGTFGGTAGMTNTGTLTIVNGNIGTIATGTSSVTGFHDTAGDIYTETPANKGAVNGKIYTCTNSITGPTSTGPNAASCAIATQARLDAQAAYLALVAMPPGANPGANLANLTLAPGVYTAASGSFLIEGGSLTLDAQGNANAVWVFQMAQTLTVGGPGAAFPQSIILSGGAQAKNVFWQVGSFATINAAGGGTMVGTIISQAGASFSTAGNVAIVTLEGRVLSLGASVTLVDTVVNVP